MAVRVSSTPSFSAGLPQKLFDDRFYGFDALVVGGHTNYDVSPVAGVS